jgi:hypothetical protein
MLFLMPFQVMVGELVRQMNKGVWQVKWGKGQVGGQKLAGEGTLLAGKPMFLKKGARPDRGST